MKFLRIGKNRTFDLAGNLILSKNPELLTATHRNVAPERTINRNYIMLNGLNFRKKLRASRAAVAYIWGSKKLFGFFLASYLMVAALSIVATMWLQP